MRWLWKWIGFWMALWGSAEWAIHPNGWWNLLILPTVIGMLIWREAPDV